MKSSNKLAGTSFSRASASQAIHVQSSADIGRARWDSIHGSKLEVWDLLSKGTSSMSTTIDEDCHRRDDEPLDLERLILLSRLPLRRRGRQGNPKSRHS
jgi:hypothetical protein